MKSLKKALKKKGNEFNDDDDDDYDNRNNNNNNNNKILDVSGCVREYMCTEEGEAAEPKKSLLPKIWKFLRCWKLLSPETAKEMFIPCPVQTTMNFIIKFFVILFGLIMIPLLPWVAITLMSWYLFTEYIIAPMLGGKIKISTLLKYVGVVIVIIIAMLFILD